jgi:hypothetical protein
VAKAQDWIRLLQPDLLMKRSRGIVPLVVASLLLLTTAPTHHQVNPHEVVVYKSARCECCNGWIEHMRKAGYLVTAHNLAAADRLQKQRDLGVPTSLNSCHTSVVDGYVVQGHVPAADVDRLLKERPKITGIGVYHMPAGSPGMESDTPEPYEVIAFSPDTSWVFAKH